MTAFKEQYSKEIQNQEIKSNKRTLKGFMWLFGLLFFDMAVFDGRIFCG